MKAFVKVNNGTFPNLNFYMAWEGFNTMGYDVQLFEEKDIDNIGITKETPVFAGVSIFRRVIDKLGVNYPPFDCYPEVLNPYYGRTLRKSTLGEVRNKFGSDGVSVFVKPVKPKVFTGVVLNSLLELIPISAVPDNTEVYFCEPMKIESEFRVYVHDGDIVGVKHYYGDWSNVPDKHFINEVVKNYKPCPISYGVDIGVYMDYVGHEPGLYGKGPVRSSFVLEVNDGCNLGNYGIDSIHYGEMIVSRWFEIMADHDVNKEISGRIAQAKEWEEKYPESSWSKDSVKRENEMFFKPNDWDGKTHKDYMVQDQTKDLKAKAMKAFAEEIQKSLNNHES
jgi:hypothetical protein